MSAIHIHAPAPVKSGIVTDFHCKARAGDGRQCGSRWLYWQFWEWYGHGGVCYFCGQHYGEGGGVGKSRGRNLEDVRAKFDAILAAKEGIGHE